MSIEETAAHLPQVIFGWNPIVVSTIVLIAAYSFIITDRINAAVISILGAGLLIFLGVLNQDLAVDGIDFNTIFLLIGMMVIVGVMKRSGIFQYVAILAAKSVRANPRLLLIVLSLITAVFSALLDNVTTVMLIVPITLLLTEQLKLKAYPFLFAQIFFSNIGGTATLIGDPPNILIGSALNFGFMDFVVNVGPGVLVITLVMLLIFDLMWGRHLTTSLKAQAHLLRYKPEEALNDIPLLLKSLFVMGLVMLGFIAGHGQGIEPGTVALFGGALLLLLDIYALKPAEQAKRVHAAFGTVEWDTIFFFIGLFILVYGVEYSGALKIVADQMAALSEGNLMGTGMLVLWGSGLVSTLLNNIPFVATMIPLIQEMAGAFGGPDKIEPLWWCLSLGACLGGNGSLIGASANVMVASFADRAGQRISFVQFLALGFPLTVVSLTIAAGYVWLVYFSPWFAH